MALKSKGEKKSQRVEFDSLINLKAKILWEGGKEGGEKQYKNYKSDLYFLFDLYMFVVYTWRDEL